MFQKMIRQKTLISGAGYGIGREIAEKFKEKHDLFFVEKKEKVV